MKMVCLMNESPAWFGRLPLTPGKSYEVVEATSIPFSTMRPFDYSGTIYKVVNDEGAISGYSDLVLRPMTKEESREEKLSDIGI